jgi:small subunit ribosomal protein S17
VNTTTATEKPKTYRCVVSSDKMMKTRVATLERLVKHPLLGKYQRKTTKYMFHDETNSTKIGDVVEIVQTRPLSARKRFSLYAVVEKA